MTEKPPIEAMVRVTPEVEMILGKTAAEIREMGLRELCELAYDKGYTITTGWPKVEPGEPGHLTIQTSPPDEEAVVSA